MQILGCITEKKDIDSVQQQMEKRLKQQASKVVRCSLGFHGGNVQADVYWFRRANIWFATEKLDNR